MVRSLSIGVLGIQGAISEHVLMMKQVLETYGYAPEVVVVRKESELDEVYGLIIPGGESTTISRFLQKRGLQESICQRVSNHSLSVMGTCAGCVLVASEIEDSSKDIIQLGFMDMMVKRNAFGRQRDSFEKILQIQGISERFPAVFIRAPLIIKTWGDCTVLSKIDEGIVMCQQGNILGLSFHPELTNDSSIHEYFLKIVEKYK